MLGLPPQWVLLLLDCGGGRLRGASGRRCTGAVGRSLARGALDGWGRRFNCCLEPLLPLLLLLPLPPGGVSDVGQGPPHLCAALA